MCNNTLSFSLTCLLFFCLGNIFSWVGIFTFKEIILLIISFTANLGLYLFVLSLLNEILLLPGVTNSFSLPLLQRRLSSPGRWRLLIQSWFKHVNHARTGFSHHRESALWAEVSHPFIGMMALQRVLIACRRVACGLRQTLQWKGTSKRSISPDWFKATVQKSWLLPGWSGKAKKGQCWNGAIKCYWTLLGKLKHSFKLAN